jgi:hypothetical protein
MRWFCLFVLVGAAVPALTPASTTAWAQAGAQEQAVQRAVKGEPDKDIRVGVYVNVRPDCSSGDLPTLRLVTPPAHGKVTIKKAKVNATNYKQCLALEVPGYVGFYRSQPNFAGNDTFAIEVRFATGRIELQQFTVTIGSSGPGQRT